MGDVDQGKAGVVRELVGAAASEWAERALELEGAQLPMFPVPVRGRGNPRAVEAIQRNVERRNEAGRPPGAQNLSTREFRAWLLARGVSPLVNLMRYALLPYDILASELGCSKLEAFREWRILQTDLAPYLHGKVAFVDDKGNAVPFLQMIVGGQSVELASGMTPWEMREKIARETTQQTSQQNQPLTLDAPAVSHDAVSHGEAK